MSEFTRLADMLYENGTLNREELLRLLALRRARSAEEDEYMASLARKRTEESFGRDIYLRGLIEFTSWCKNDCLYCGIRRSNKNARRYRLDKDEIIGCCLAGYELGFRTFVLQGGEDAAYSDGDICSIVSGIKERLPDTAVTLSIGEKERKSYEAYYAAGADRYLLRHETANGAHYSRLHPPELSLAHRKKCLFELKETGFQVGAGFMVGSPFQTDECLADDFEFLKELGPHMIGIGPFIPHHDTPFRDMPAGTLADTLFCLSALRLMFPRALLPATTALGTIDATGREKGVLHGANVAMPNLSPKSVRGDYLLYDGKICTGDEAAECRYCMERRMNAIGRRIVADRGDYPGFVRK